MTEPRTETRRVRAHVWGKMNLNQKEQKEKGGKGEPQRGQEQVIRDQGRKVARTLFQESDLGKKEGLAGQAL